MPNSPEARADERLSERASLQKYAQIGPKYRVLIAHPGRQHSHQAALALYEAGYLACYATGIPTSTRHFGPVGRRLMRKFSLYDDVDLPLHLIKLNMLSPAMNRLLARTLPQAMLDPLLYQTYRMFDRWAARLVARNQFDAVIAYENSALHTFEAAKKKGAACILDAASLHHVEAAQRLRLGRPSVRKIAVDRRKDREIALSDCIITASRLAAESYIGHVGPGVQVKPISLGADIDRFKPAPQSAASLKSEPFTFVFVGTATRAKGFDLLIDAIEQLLDDGFQFKIAVAGNIDRSLLEGRARARQTICEYGQIRHDELVLVLRDAHCLVLPSRLDSFGMVVPEAMACGLPVIVSDMVGAKELVQDARNGFIVPTGNVDALVGKMRWLILNRAVLKKMAIAARSAAEQASWVNYRRRFASAVQDVLRGR